jgi:hypothetical protein
VRIERAYEPDPGRQRRYAQRFQLYRELHPALAQLNRRLA